MVKIVALPFVPEPYEDEILGSWLARVELVNGSGSWRSLLEYAGYGHKLQASLFDLVDFDDRLARFLAGVGVSYDYAMRNMSTLKFWSHLRGTKDWSVPGTDGIVMPARKMTSNVPVGKLFRLGVHVGSAVDKHRWHCPACVEQDVSEGKTPYWRRLHQLPTSFYCVAHHVALQDACYSCGASTRPHHKKGWGLLSVMCECGADRRSLSSEKVDVSPFFQRLAKIGADAIRLESAPWCARDVHDAAVNLAIRKNGKRVRSYYTTALEALGATKLNYREGRLCPPLAKKEFYISSIGASAVLLAPSVFAEMNISLSDAMENYLNANLADNRRGHFNASNHATLGRKGARSHFMNLMSKGERIYGRFSFWYLRLHDREWLESYVGRKLPACPTIEKDRRAANEKIETGLLPAPDSPLMTRLCLRDRSLYDKIIQLSRNKAEKKERRKRNLTPDRIIVLTRALKAILADENEPKRITYGMLGKRVKLTAAQVMLAVQASPVLKAAVDDANSKKRNRQWRWAIRMEYEASNGAPLRITDISRRAKLPLGPESGKYIRSCLEEIYGIQIPPKRRLSRL